jgi:integrase
VGSNPTPSARTLFANVRRRSLTSEFIVSFAHLSSVCVHRHPLQSHKSLWYSLWDWADNLGTHMAHKLNRLTARAVATATKPGLYADGGGLYLRVGRGGAKSWCLRYMLGSKAREMGLGGLAKLPLADARKKAAAQRALLADKIDPLARREAEHRAKKIEAARAMMFDDCAAAYIKAHKDSWQNAKHRQQWENTLATYVMPVFGAVSVADVDVAMVMKVVEPLWSAKPETAGRVRGRIESVLDWAKARGFRDGENPARWRGHLSNLLPARSKIRAVKHHAALPYADVGAFMADLRTREGFGADALEFLILTTTRTSEVIGARWPEIDFATRLWTIPAARMKARREHRVPLSTAALAVLKRMQRAGGDFVFPGAKSGQGLSNMAMLVLLGRMGRGDLTAHGFRATFKTWASERTNFPRELVEAALAHVLDDKTEAAYQRGDMLEKRRRLMDAWAEYCAKSAVAGAVVSLRTVRLTADRCKRPERVARRSLPERA